MSLKPFIKICPIFEYHENLFIQNIVMLVHFSYFQKTFLKFIYAKTVPIVYI